VGLKRTQTHENAQSNHPDNFVWAPSGAALGKKTDPPGYFIQPSLKSLVSLVMVWCHYHSLVKVSPGESVGVFQGLLACAFTLSLQ